MSTTYLVLTNRTLRELNETELTSVNFNSSRGIQTAVKDFVNKSIHDIYNEAGEIPLLHSTTTKTTNTGTQEYTLESNMRKVDWDSFFLKPSELITNGEFATTIDNWTTDTGSPAHSSLGNGRLSLSNASSYQSISTIVNKQYKIQVRGFDTNADGDTLTIKVGTSAGGTQNLSSSITVSDYGAGEILDTTFTATATTTYIHLATTGDFTVDYVRVSRQDVTPRKLKYISYDNWLQSFKERDSKNDDGVYATPEFVYRKPDYGYFGLSPIPDKDDYTIEYDYFTTHTDLSASTDTMSLPDRFAPLIVDRAKYYTYMLRSDAQHASMAERDYQRKLRLLRVDYSSRQEYMRDTRINQGTRVQIV
ncbi:MAG: hypothetical protein ACO3UU_06225 [Minisyncoccia bacterium]